MLVEDMTHPKDCKHADHAVIEEANWLTLEDDVRHMEDVEEGTRFDAVVCLGNSLSALPDFEGGLTKQRRALSNFWALVRPGGLLVIDHRNYDSILDSGVFPSSNIYYDVSLPLHARILQPADKPYTSSRYQRRDVKKMQFSNREDYVCSKFQCLNAPKVGD